MRDIFCSEPFILAITFGCYYLGLRIEKATKLSIANPLLISMILIIGIMLALNIDYKSYEEGSHFIELLLGPSVVALGYTLYKQIDNIKGNMVTILLALFCGSIIGIVSVIADRKSVV